MSERKARVKRQDELQTKRGQPFDLSIADRFGLLQILPEKGHRAEMLVIDELARSIGFSEAELDAIDYRVEGELARWDAAKAAAGMKMVEVSPRAHVIIADALKALDSKSEFPRHLLNLWRLFVETE